MAYEKRVDPAELMLWDQIRNHSSAYVVGAGLRQIGTPRAPVIAVNAFSGIRDYHPEDLVVTVGAATRLAELNKVLGEHQQWLPACPIDGGDDTIGGLVAAGVDGWLKGSQGPCRDRVLGLRVVTPAFGPVFVGSRVVKSVAGYNLTRIMAGTRGALGVITAVVLKVSPHQPTKTWLAPFSAPMPPAEARARFSATGRPWWAWGLMRFDGQNFLYAIGDENSRPEWLDFESEDKPLPFLPTPPDANIVCGAVPAGQAESFWVQCSTAASLQVDLHSGAFFAALTDREAWSRMQAVVRDLGGSLRLLRGLKTPEVRSSSDRLWRRLKRQFDPEGCLRDFEEVSG